jgi:DNA-binding winged helix-turn-helix (wHTH) protein
VPRFGSFVLDPDRRQLLKDGVEVHLTPKAFALLSVLVDAAPRVVPKRELHDKLWPGGIVSDATLLGLVKEVRRALDDQGSDAPMIRTAHRVGFALESRVERTAVHPLW